MPITSVVAEPIHGRIRSDIAIISSLGEHVVGQYVLVRVADDAGRVGLGEASVTSVWSGETQAGAIALIRDVFAPLVLGADHEFQADALLHAHGVRAAQQPVQRHAERLAL